MTKSLPLSTLDSFPSHHLSPQDVDRRWKSAVSDLRGIFSKVLVLDDDPTGSQTVYDIPVYTGFTSADLLSAHRDDSHVVYVLTNSRSLIVGESESLHRNLIRNWIGSGSSKEETLYISRSDSTLRGHYPQETRVLRNELARLAPEGSHHPDIRGVILIPFFPEGGRYTFDDIHYVGEEDRLIPAGKTEFAKDRSFGYSSSNLKDYVEEKTNGGVKAENVISISIDILRAGDIHVITEILTNARENSVIVVNAVCYDDLKLFVIALIDSFKAGARYLLRCAASTVKVLAGLNDRPLLEKPELYSNSASTRPGILVAGSYVKKTTKQLTTLVEQNVLSEVKLNIRKALSADKFSVEIARARNELTAHISAGRSVCIYTTNAGKREFLRAKEGKEDLSDLELSARISTGLVDLISGIESQPGWIITKGGITSHDISVKSLKIKRATVLGQILPGVPVWRSGEESRWPGIPLVIFPGNVGDDFALLRAVEKLIE